MPKTLPIQESFNSGVIDPLLHGQVSSDIYKTGLATLINGIALPQGAVTIRKGFSMVNSQSNFSRGAVIPGSSQANLITLNK
jgi:hypothetical protein